MTSAERLIVAAAEPGALLPVRLPGATDLLERLGAAGLAVRHGDRQRFDARAGVRDRVEAFLDDLEEARRSTGVDRVDVLSLGEPGLVGVCAAALRPDAVRSLILVATPVDFGEGGRGGRRAACGPILPAPWPGEAFRVLTSPVIGRRFRHEFLPRDVVRLALARPDPDPGSAPLFVGPVSDTLAAEWVEVFHRTNLLMRGELRIGGDLVDLSRLTMPLLAIGPETGLPGWRELGHAAGAETYTERVMPGDSRTGDHTAEVASTIVAWLSALMPDTGQRSGSPSRADEAGVSRLVRDVPRPVDLLERRDLDP